MPISIYDVLSGYTRRGFSGRFKTAKAKILTSKISSKNWLKHRHETLKCTNGFCYIGDKRVKTAEKIVASVNPSEYLLSHCTIMASVQTEEGDNPNVEYKDYFINRDTEDYINDNNDAWEFKLLLSSHKTFIGSENYLEHVQIPIYSRGKVLDAIPRVVTVIGKYSGEPIQILYVDILVATHRSHEDLIAQILSGEVDSLSMGCNIEFSICSQCGKVVYEDEDMCDHLSNNRGGWFVDRMGHKRRVAELCGHWTKPESNQFIEASWVSIPAFKGAVRRDIINDERFMVENKISVEKSWRDLEEQKKMLKRATVISDERMKKYPPEIQEAFKVLSKVASRVQEKDGLVDNVVNGFVEKVSNKESRVRPQRELEKKQLLEESPQEQQAMIEESVEGMKEEDNEGFLETRERMLKHRNEFDDYYFDEIWNIFD